MRTLIKLLVLAAVLAGCATTPPTAEIPMDAAGRAMKDLRDGNYAPAIREFIRLAAEHPSPKRQEYQLFAAEAMLGNQEAQSAQQLLRRIDAEVLPKHLQARHQLLSAQAALALRDSDRALAVLAVPLAPPTASAWYARYHELRARAYALAGNHLESAREYILRTPYLDNAAALAADQEAIWSALSMLSAPALQQLQMQPPPDVLSGWMELAYIGKQYQSKPAEVRRLIENWRLRFPTHPASNELVDSLLTRSQELAVEPAQIAILLPLSGKYVKAANAVLEGILAAYYDSSLKMRSALRVYDTAIAEQAPQIYRQAIEDGAEFVIGPLRKEAVAALVAESEFSVPTLALNVTELAEKIPNLFQFTLSPEEEARQVAEHAWLGGYTYAAAFTPMGDWGSRIYKAFDERWQELGGQVVSHGEYNARENDFSAPMQAMLNVRDSKQRRKYLETVLGRKVEFTPHRRQDIEFVFIAGFPRQARLIRPQLKFHHASQLPVYSTSHVFSGKVDRNKDRDMDGIEFGDMPWTLQRAKVETNLSPRSIAFLQNRNQQLQRLFAMGVDAYHLVPVIKVLASFPFERFQGVTGSLSVDADQHVKRQIRWAKFQGGIPRLQKMQQNVETPSF